MAWDLLQQIQQQLSGNSGPWRQNTLTTGTSSNAITIWADSTASRPSTPEKPKATPKVQPPETALEWLDRRVNEMRVAL